MRSTPHLPLSNSPYSPPLFPIPSSLPHISPFHPRSSELSILCSLQSQTRRAPPFGVLHPGWFGGSSSTLPSVPTHPLLSWYNPEEPQDLVGAGEAALPCNKKKKELQEQSSAPPQSAGVWGSGSLIKTKALQPHTMSGPYKAPHLSLGACVPWAPPLPT